MSVSISAVISCYNYGKFVQFAIESILNQTYSDFEIIIINDGSHDNSEQVIKGFLPDPRIKYFYQKNQGQAVAKNNGIKYSQGEFIAFLDADDIWDKNKLEKQYRLFKNEKVGVVYSRAKYMLPDNSITNDIERGKYLQPRRGNIASWLIFDNFIPFSSSIVRKTCFNTTGLFDESLSMGIDWDLWLRLSLKWHFDYIEDKLITYRVGHSNQMSKNTIKRRECVDHIFYAFTKKHGMLLGDSIIKKAKSYSYYNAGYAAIQVDINAGINFFLKSLKLNFTNINSFKGLVKCMFIMILKRFKPLYGKE